MANLFTLQSCDLQYISVQDVRDTLGTPISALTDNAIEKLIMQAEDTVNSYLKTLNYDNACNCSNDYPVPIEIKRATVLMVQEIYDYQNAPTTTGSTLQPGDIIREKSCDTEIEYYVGKTTSTDYVDPCTDIPCDVKNMLECFRVNSLKMPLCAPCSFSSCSCL